VKRIHEVRPDLVLVEHTVARQVKEDFAKLGITLVANLASQVSERSSERPDIESPWLQLTSDCQRC
jgi:hypothetical protein